MRKKSTIMKSMASGTHCLDSKTSYITIWPYKRHLLCPFFLLLKNILQFSWLQSLSCLRIVATPWTVAPPASLSITNCWTLLKFISIESVMLSNHLILCQPLFHPSSIFPSIRVFYNESVHRIRWPKDWSFSISQSFQWILRTDFLQDWLVWSPCSTRDSQDESL